MPNNKHIATNKNRLIFAAVLTPDVVIDDKAIQL